MIALPNSNKHRRVAVTMDRHNVSNLEDVIVDGKDKFESTEVLISRKR